MRRQVDPNISGNFLVSDFQTAFVSIATVEAVKYEAQRSETSLMNQLNTLVGNSYLNPGNINSDLQSDLTRSSINAHMKKAQAQQLDIIGAAQLQNLIVQDQADYTGRKIQVDVIHTDLKPIDSVWFNPQSGYRANTTKKKRIIGVIEEVLLDENMVIIKPGIGSRLLNREFKNYIVYVINPTTLEPMVKITLL